MQIKIVLLIAMLNLFFLFTSCEKKIVEIIPVLVVEKDMSISGASDIKYFSFPSSKIGYTASPSDFIYKTIDGGSTWTQITIAIGKTCKGLEFFDENNGMSLMNTDVYVTTDGGQTWSIKGNGDFIGITENGIGVLGDCGQTTCIIKTTTDKGQNFLLKGGMNYGISFEFLSARVIDSKVIIFSKTGWEHPNENVFDFSNNSSYFIGFGSLTHDEIPNDIYLSSNQGTIVGNYGLIMDDLAGYSRTFYRHAYPFYSIDGYGNFKVCVGEKTIVSNLNIGSEENWNEVFDVNGNGLTNTFYKIRFISQNTFYLSGSGGLILKASI